MAETTERLIAVRNDAHWYWPDGRLCFEIEGARGKMVKPDVRHGRKFGLYPSKTTVTKQMAAPFLERWKQEQAILSSLTLPRLDGESLDNFAKRVVLDMVEEGRKTAERGTQLGAEIETGLMGGDLASPLVERAVSEIRTWLTSQGFGGVPLRTQVPVLGHGRFPTGGTADVVGKHLLGDIKTTDLAKFRTPYNEWKWQLAGYASDLWWGDAQWCDTHTCVDWVVDRTSGEMRSCAWTAQEMAHGSEEFALLAEMFYRLNKLGPFAEGR